MKATVRCLIGAIIFLSGCTRVANITPVNTIATDSPRLYVTFKAYGLGTGEVFIHSTQGEKFNGRYNLYREQNILSYNMAVAMAVFGAPRVRQAGIEYVNGTPLWSPGIADASSTSGKSVHCELMNNNQTGHGQGGCQTTDGGLYRLDY